MAWVCVSCSPGAARPLLVSVSSSARCRTAPVVGHPAPATALPRWPAASATAPPGWPAASAASSASRSRGSAAGLSAILLGGRPPSCWATWVSSWARSRRPFVVPGANRPALKTMFRADGVGLRVDGGDRRGGQVAGMDPHMAKVAADHRLHEPQRRPVQRAARRPQRGMNGIGNLVRLRVTGHHAALQPLLVLFVTLRAPTLPRRAARPLEPYRHRAEGPSLTWPQPAAGRPAARIGRARSRRHRCRRRRLRVRSVVTLCLREITAHGGRRAEHHPSRRRTLMAASCHLPTASASAAGPFATVVASRHRAVTRILIRDGRTLDGPNGARYRASRMRVILDLAHVPTDPEQLADIKQAIEAASTDPENRKLLARDYRSSAKPYPAGRTHPAGRIRHSVARDTEVFSARVNPAFRS